MKTKICFGLLVLLLAFASCKEKKETGLNWPVLDLMPHGLPIAVMAPDSARVSVTKVGAIEDVTVINEGAERYSVQIYVQPVITSDMAELKANQINEVKSNADFLQILEEDERSFLYSLKQLNGTTYSFRYVHLQADKEYVFTTGFNETFTLEEAKRLLQAVRQNQETGE
ncbi:MAG: hypothetical protein IPH16_18025 [Haliscomenobacter sp.]|nr:hypothetical protein [Haliscomenobacter sp.]MBK7476219.1 hypothetical protein [Haliscomenobacter sp.]MBK8880697.1 hypothetical protein [Haliscomenobacter sp.]